MGGNNRTDLQIGSRVRVEQKENQKSGILTEGVVTAILNKSAFHPHGIKVRLDNGSVGRVKVIIQAEAVKGRSFRLCYSVNVTIG